VTVASRMKPVEAVLAAVLLAGLAGCAARAKQTVATAAPAVPPQPAPPLSVPQTQVELPRSQPVDPGAFATAPPLPEPVAVTPSAPAAPAPKPQRRTNPAPPKPDATPPPVEIVRPPIQEIIPVGEQQRLRKSAQDHRREALQLVAQAQRHSLTAAEQALVTRISQFVKSSNDAEKTGDLRSADDLAGRAVILAKDLQSGK